MTNSETTLNDIVALAKRRGFVFPGSEIYGGLANTYDYGPLGVELMRNIKNHWWQHFVTHRSDISGLDSSILMNPRVWEASGHVANFADALVDCKNCQHRTRADHLIEDHFEKLKQEVKVEGVELSELEALIINNQIPCPNCQQVNWTTVRKFNQLFQTHIGIVPEHESLAYLRGEIAQGMFVNFKQVLDTMRPKLPFGLAQSGPAFRNEITLGNFIFRTLQFNLSECEYFFDPEVIDWQQLFEQWQQHLWDWATQGLGLSPDNLRWRPHTDEERAHYSKRTEDLDFRFPFGFKEMFAVAYRTDYDLRNHMAQSGQDLRFLDSSTGRKFVPHVMEPTFGIDRAMLAILCNGYKVEEVGGKQRTVLAIKPNLAPYQVAIFPLLANKPELTKLAEKIHRQLQEKYAVTWDQRGNIGKRYFAQDEIGTPWCVTVDFDSLDDKQVTIRDRDTTNQQRLPIAELDNYFHNQLT